MEPQSQDQMVSRTSIPSDFLFAKKTAMPQFLGQPANGDPTTAEIFRIFRNTTMASLEGLRLLLEECAELRAELVTILGLHSGGDDHRVFCARQQDRILELKKTAKDMQVLVASLSQGASEGEAEASPDA